MFFFTSLGYALFKEAAYCHPQHIYSSTNGGMVKTVEACFQICKKAKLFHYNCNVGGRDDCKCVCYMKANSNGGCDTKEVSDKINLYKIR